MLSLGVNWLRSEQSHTQFRFAIKPGVKLKSLCLLSQQCLLWQVRVHGEFWLAFIIAIALASQT